MGSLLHIGPLEPAAECEQELDNLKLVKHSSVTDLCLWEAVREGEAEGEVGDGEGAPTLLPGVKEGEGEGEGEGAKFPVS